MGRTKGVNVPGGAKYKVPGERTVARVFVPWLGPPPQGKPYIVPSGELMGKLICGQKVSKSDPPRACCQRPGPNGRCYIHAQRQRGVQGPGVGGGQRPNTRDKWRQALPARFQESYDAGLEDKTLEGLRAKMLILDALLQEKLKGLGEDSGKELWATAKRKLGVVQSLMKGYKGDGLVGLRSALDGLEEAIRAGLRVALGELDVRGIIQEGVGVAKVELDRMKLLGQFVPEQQVNVIVSCMSAAVTGALPEGLLVNRVGPQGEVFSKGIELTAEDYVRAGLPPPLSGAYIRQQVQIEFIRLVGSPMGELQS